MIVQEGMATISQSILYTDNTYHVVSPQASWRIRGRNYRHIGKLTPGELPLRFVGSP